MAQDIIDIGPQPNDGQGDNLRTAFDKTNDNFTQIWTAGPVGSNVRVAGNVISTLQVNQDLALSPNGVGNVRLNNNTIPGANNTWFLGSATMQWRGLYAAAVETGNITITGTLNVPGDAVIQGNLTVEGNTIQIGNIVTDTKTIQLANTAANAIQANGSGITVGASDNIATFLYNSTSNSWVTNLQITNANGQPIGTTPGGSNTYIQFNDAGNFGGNANFTYNRATGNFYLGGANLRAVSGNNQPYILQVPGIAFQGGQAIMEWNPNNQHIDISNSLSISGTLAVYGNYPGAGALIATSGGSGVDITIEPSGNLYLNADGGEVIVSDQTVSVSPNSGALKVLGGIGVNGNINAGGNISAVGWTGNLIPSANAVYSLGNSTKYWANLWVANNTIYIGGVPLGMTAGNVLTVGGNAVLQNNSNSTISTTGNISANYFVGNGSLLTGLAATYGNANVVANLAALGSNPISTTGNISGNYFVGNGSQLTGIVSSYGNANVANYLPTFSGNISAGNITTTGNITGAYVKGNGSELTSLPAPTVTQDITSNGAMSIMTYDGVIKYVNYATVEPSSGNIAAGNISTTGNVTANNFIGLLGNITNLDSVNFAVENISALVGNNGVNIGAGGYNNLVVLPAEVLIQNVPLTVAGNILSTVAGGLNITANAPANGTAQIWNFGTDGRLTFPGTPRIDTDSDNFEVQAAESISLEANAVVNIYTDSSGNAYQWQFGDDGNFTAPGNVSVTGNITGNYFIGDGSQLTNLPGGNATLPLANGTSNFNIATANGSANITANAVTYTFGTDSRLTVPAAANVPGKISALTAATGRGHDLRISAGNTNGCSVAGGDMYLSAGVGYGGVGWGAGNVNIVTGDRYSNDIGNTWRFDFFGNLTLPGNTIAINYLNGNLAFGTVTFNNEAVIGTGTSNTVSGLYLAPDPVSLTNDLYLRVRGNILDEPTHIHFDTGNNQYYNQFIGDDNKYIQLANTGNIVINSNDNVGNTAQWNFDTTGNLTLPTDGYLVVTTGIIGSGASPAPSLSGFSSIATTGSPGNISASGNLLVSGYANITGNINGSNAIFSGNVTGNTAGFAIGYLNIPQVAFTANTTLTATDAGKHYYSTLATANTLTIANNTSVSWVVGTAITVVNRGSGNITVAQGTGVSLYLAGNSSAANRTVSTYGMATLLNVAANVWMINGTGVV